MNEISMFENLVRGMLKKVYTALSGKITAVDPENMKCKVLVSRTDSFEDSLETGWIPLRSLYAGEGHGLCMIPYVDDECVILFQDKDLNDAFVIPFSFNHETAPPPETPEGKLRIGDILLQHKSGTYIYINPKGVVEVYEKEGNKLRLSDGYIQMKTRDGQEVQTQNKCNVSQGTDKILKQWTLLKTGSETLVLEDKRQLGLVEDKETKTNTVPEEQFTLDRDNTEESAEAMDEYLDRADQIPYRDYHGLKYIQCDSDYWGTNFQKIGMDVSGKKNPRRIDTHDGEEPIQSFEQIIQNPLRQSMGIFRVQITEDNVSLSFLITRQMGGKQVKTGFDAFIDDTTAFFNLNGNDYKYQMDPSAKRYNDELEHLGEEIKECFELRDHPVKKE